jgi:hypothetical protein
LAWKTCTRKADAAVSAQVYQLLVSILPSCPSSLAIPLLKAVQASLVQQSHKKQRDYLFEVSEFCSALAAANSGDQQPHTNNSNNKGGASGSGAAAASAVTTMSLADDVRAEVLELLWAVLTHKDASTLKSYDSLKRYVTNELRVEPKGSLHRERYMRSCIDSLSSNTQIMDQASGSGESASSASSSSSSTDETQALRVVKLTHFVLEACPREQAGKLVMVDRGALPILLFNELTAYLKRRKAGPPASVQNVRKVSYICNMYIYTKCNCRKVVLL